MAKIITTKKIKITSRGRYVHRKGVTFGPTGHFYQEKVETLKELLTKYADIVIIEELKDKSTIQLNLDNVEKDNTRTPISIMGGENGSVNPPTTGDNQNNVERPENDNQDAVHIDVTPESNDSKEDAVDDVVIDGVQTDAVPSESNVGENDDVNSTESNDSKEDAVEETESTPVEKDDQPKQQNNGQQNKNNKNKGKNKGNNHQNNASKASTEVMPEEA